MTLRLMPVFAACVLITGSPVFAAEKTRSRFMEICGADLQKFCADVKAGEGRKRACLMQHKDELAPECQALLERVQKRRERGMTPLNAHDVTTER